MPSKSRLNSHICATSMLFLVTLLPHAHAQNRVSNPVPEKIRKPGLAISLEDFVQIPASDPRSSAKARINMLRTAQDSSGRLFVNDLRGQLYVIQDATPSIYLDLNVEEPNFMDSPGLGTGFASFAFHPEFKTNGKFYTAHCENPGSGSADFAGPVQPYVSLQGVITEWTASDPAANVFAGARRELMRVDIYGVKHGFQDMGFNPTADASNPDYGKLYVCLGDGFSVDLGNPNNAHRLDSILGTVIRIDPMGSDSQNGKYGVPADNPFAADGDSTTLGEIWAWGFRNPHRISWDRGGDHKMLIGDIGHHGLEEINIGIPGGNYGWNLREGTFIIDPFANLDDIYPLSPRDSIFNLTYPSAQYDHDEGFAIVGGYVYRGSKVRDLVGMYVFGDIKNGRMFYVPVDSLELGKMAEIYELTLLYQGTERTILNIVNHRRADLRFGIDDDNELYVLSKVDGSIRKIVKADRLSTGIESHLGPLQLSLHQNYPNPFNPSTAIGFSTPRAGPARLEIVDTTGKLVKLLFHGQTPAGYSEVRWNGTDESNRRVGSGVYFSVLKSGSLVQTRKMVLLQ